MQQHQRVRSLTARFYLFAVAVDFAPIYTLYSVMFAHNGLSTFEISAAIAAWSAASLVFEVPSGVLADRIDRRHVLVLSQTFTAVAFVLWWLWPGFWAYTLGFVIWGVGGAFHSGTFEALVYDELDARGEASRFATVTGRIEAVSLVAVVTSALLASAVMRWGFDAVVLSSLGFALAGIAVPLLFPKAPPKQSVEDEHYFTTFRRGLAETRRFPGFLPVLSVMALIGCVSDMLDEYGPLFYADAGFGPSRVALVAAGVLSVSAIVISFVGRFSVALRWHPAMLIAAGLLMITGVSTSGLAAAAAYGVAAIAMQATWILSRAELQHTIVGDLRATATSLVSFAGELLNLVALLALGAVADATTRLVMFDSLGTFSFATGLVALGVLQVQHRRRLSGGSDGGP